MFKFLLPFAVFSVLAADLFTYEIAGSHVSFSKEDQVLVNSSCEKKCDAFKMGMKFKTQKIASEDRQGGKNPASVRCTKYMKGDVIFGQDRAGNQQSFCFFSDKSYLLNQ